MRSSILWVGLPPSDDVKKAFDDRGLVLVAADLQRCADLWESARAITVVDPDDTMLEALRSRVVPLAVAHGLVVRISVPLERVRATVDVFKHEQSYGHELQVCTPSSYHLLPEQFARLAPGPSCSSAVAIEGDQSCSEEEKILLRRAFCDCALVRLEPLPGGSTAVFHAYARLTDSRVGRYPLPLFVKLDKRHRARRELANYGECTTEFIPFFARPNLSPRRCLVGPTRGLIVGDFVERSESLQDLVQRGVAQPAIDSLFQDALRGWRAQAFWGRDANVTVGALQERCFDRAYLAKRADVVEDYSLQAGRMGAPMSARDAAAVLDALPPIAHRRGWCHGDLHGYNVRVRGSDAILIDFAAVGEGALARDPAALETSLALKFQAPTREWISVMTELYQLDHLRVVPRPREPMGPLGNLWNAVRQIRRYGLAEQLTELEYARGVAIQLLQHALRRRDSGEQRARRPLYVMLAARLAADLHSASRASAQEADTPLDTRVLTAS